ncbi:MAG TPA: GlsB/YeaQ/YmgE family stress response membrane protein [Rhizomicrobium sp.]|jgi:uncharacterized membrane protein YeaQ/YmgE (transglycosylase-associated protein family)|nr:GlsB/YeaQ/YmgE family stress response membrane protein [Rhizomicrobium sp.]
MAVISWIFFGAFIGWLAGFFMPKPQQGCLVNIALGLVGALLGGFIFQALTGGNFSYDQHGLIVSSLVAVIGAVLVLAIWNALHRR